MRRQIPLLLLFLFTAPCASAQPEPVGRPFSFRTVEYMPRDERLAMGQAFIARSITPGMPVARAVTVLEHAGVHCGGVGPTGEVDCLRSSFARRPFELMREITWRVRLSSSRDGRVTGAAVSRDVVGG
jgi:hypothetical protein